MSIEQTNQLILLILNSVLMMLLSAALLGGAWLRQNMLSQQLHQLKLRYRALTHGFELREGAAEPLKNETAQADTQALNPSRTKASLKKIRSDRQRLSNQYLWSHIGMLMLHMVLLVFSVSLLALALRSLLSFDSLISTALFLFTLGSAGLLGGTSCILIDLAQGNNGSDSLGQSIGKAMSQLGHWWSRRKTRASWVGTWQKEPVPLLVPNKSRVATARHRTAPTPVTTPPKVGQ